MAWYRGTGRENHKSVFENPSHDRCIFCGGDRTEIARTDFTIIFSEYEYSTGSICKTCYSANAKTVKAFQKQSSRNADQEFKNPDTGSARAQYFLNFRQGFKRNIINIPIIVAHLFFFNLQILSSILFLKIGSRSSGGKSLSSIPTDPSLVGAPTL